jgi:Antitoxin VbhA
MDDIVSTRPVKSKTISDAEMARRRGIVRQADANNRLEGIFREPETDAIVEAFVRGDIEATDVVSLFKAHLEPR